MSSYIKFMFNYLFQGDLDAHLIASEANTSSPLARQMTEPVNPSSVGMGSSPASPQTSPVVAAVADDLTRAQQVQVHPLQPNAIQMAGSSRFGGNCSILARIFAAQSTAASKNPQGPTLASGSPVPNSNSTPPVGSLNPFASLTLSPVRSFAELDSWLRQQSPFSENSITNTLDTHNQNQWPPTTSEAISIRTMLNSSNATASVSASAGSNPINLLAAQHESPTNSSSIQLLHQLWQHPLLQRQSDTSLETERQLELQECFNQIQLHDYYASYDIFIGLRIASSLTILFIVFILFVMYKTGCRDSQYPRKGGPRSQLEMVSSSGSGSHIRKQGPSRPRSAARGEQPVPAAAPTSYNLV